MVEVGGRHTTFRDYTTHPFQIAVMAENAEDVGVELMFEAQDEYSTYHNITVSTVTPPSISINGPMIRSIRAVSKPITKGRIRVYAYDPNIDSRTLIAIYQPDDANPSFRRFRVPCKSKCLVVYAMKKYKDLVDGKELVEFTPDAMIYAILALNSRENRKAQEFMNNLAMAVQEQEKEMESDEIPVASPPKFMDYRRPENLVVDTFLGPSANDYFMWP